MTARKLRENRVTRRGTTGGGGGGIRIRPFLRMLQEKNPDHSLVLFLNMLLLDFWLTLTTDSLRLMAQNHHHRYSTPLKVKVQT